MPQMQRTTRIRKHGQDIRLIFPLGSLMAHFFLKIFNGFSSSALELLHAFFQTRLLAFSLVLGELGPALLPFLIDGGEGWEMFFFT